VLEGPAGVQFGRGSTGGVINQESKVPAADRFLHVDTAFGTDATRRIAGDVNEPMGGVAGGSAFRLNAMGRRAALPAVLMQRIAATVSRRRSASA
jgi:catecholate siderophore receptor